MLGAYDVARGKLQPFLNVPDALRLEFIGMGVEQMRIFKREVARAQHMETFVRLRKIRMRFFDDHTGLAETQRCVAGDLGDLAVDRRDAEIARISNALRFPSRAHRIDKGLS